MGDAIIISCPHCNAENHNFSSFCGTCGKALPGSIQSGPHIITGAAMPSTGAGRQLVSEELQKHLKKAKGALLAVAIMQSIFGLIIFGVTKATLPAGHGLPPILFITIFGIAVVFYGLYAWARHNPLPAAIVGLTVFVTLHLIDGMVDPAQLARGIFVKIIIVAILVQGIQAGIKYKRLLPELQPLA
jgi:hypothetical protein